MNIPTNLKFAESNEWIKVEGNLITIGISDYAQSQLSDIVFAEIVVAADEVIAAGDSIATIESVKAAADVYTPASGKVVAINEELPAAPEVINSAPYEAGWMIKLELSSPADLDKLMDSAAYEKFVQEQE
jgi:glycine cleavage system H protein